MDTAGKVSVPALRALTYCFLIKAIVSMAMFACTAATGFVTTHPDREIPGLIVVFVIAQAVRLLNSIMCILSLANVTALSKRFATAQAFIITGVIMECAVLTLIFKSGVVVNAAFYLSWAVMDLLMYGRADSATFSIWRKRAFKDGK